MVEDMTLQEYLEANYPNLVKILDKYKCTKLWFDTMRNNLDIQKRYLKICSISNPIAHFEIKLEYYKKRIETLIEVLVRNLQSEHIELYIKWSGEVKDILLNTIETDYVIRSTMDRKHNFRLKFSITDDVFSMYGSPPNNIYVKPK